MSDNRIVYVAFRGNDLEDLIRHLKEVEYNKEVVEHLEKLLEISNG